MLNCTFSLYSQLRQFCEKVKEKNMILCLIRFLPRHGGKQWKKLRSNAVMKIVLYITYNLCTNVSEYLREHNTYLYVYPLNQARLWRHPLYHTICYTRYPVHHSKDNIKSERKTQNCSQKLRPDININYFI